MTGASAVAVRSVVLARVSDLLARAEHPGVRLPRPDRLRAEAEGGVDRILYVAHRDLYVRTVGEGPDAGRVWRGDLVCYTGGTLANDEPVRSIGHWNTPEQTEIFQVQSGRVVMVVALPGEPHWLSAAEYTAGEVCAVPAGAFHLTYAPWDAATVYNIYTDPQQAAGKRTGKYAGRRAPDYAFGQRPTVPGPVPVPERALIPEDLVDALAVTSDRQLTDLRHAIGDAQHDGWPRRLR